MPAVQAFVDTLPGQQAEAAAESGERDATRRRRRRGGRGRGRDEASAEGVTAMIDDSQGTEQAVDSAPTAAESMMTETRRVVEAMSAEPHPVEAEIETVPAPMQAPAQARLMPAVPEMVPAAPAAAVTLVEPTPVTTPYQLPTDTLASLASGAGLQWINSDAEKIRAVQEAMANEPKPIHVPRQPRPRAAVDDGPLVLVETKKDLSQVRLPFDANMPASAP
jgi:ribonuclease E